MDLDKLELGGGTVEILDTEGMCLHLPLTLRGYADAQIDDTQHRPRVDFRWKPPLHFHVRARSSPETPQGTLGFGFWNDPFTFSLGQAGAARRLPAPPQAIWYFYGSDPNDIQLIPNSVGSGWKAMVLRSPRLSSLLTLPLGAVGAGLAQLPIFRSAIMRAAQYVISADEARLRLDMCEWHTYEIFWEIDSARFLVDGVEVLSSRNAPSGPLGFVAWIDNQYAVASPRGGFRFGFLPTEQAQWLELQGMKIQSA